MTDDERAKDNAEMVGKLETIASQVRMAAGRILMMQARNAELAKELDKSVNAHADTTHLLQRYMKHVTAHVMDVPIPDKPNEHLDLADLDALWRLR